MAVNKSYDAEISAVYDWKGRSWDVLLDFGNNALAVEWPRHKKPEIGEHVVWDGRNGIRWRDMELPIDVRKFGIDSNGNVYLD